MKTLIIHDDFALAAKARANLERAARLAGEVTEGDVTVCPRSMLEEATGAAEALQEAADAHLIVVALAQLGPLPEELRDWLARWARCRQVQDAALAVFPETGDAPRSTPAVRELTRLAEREGLSLIFDDAGWSRKESAVFERSLREREVALTPTLLHLLDEPVHEPYRGWGLND